MERIAKWVTMKVIMAGIYLLLAWHRVKRALGLIEERDDQKTFVTSDEIDYYTDYHE